MRYAWQNLKHHARQRGIGFTLTLEEFGAIVVPEGYIQGRGRTADALQVDRIDQRRGYEAGNVRVVLTSENARLERWRQLGIEPGDADESEAAGPAEWEEVA